MLGQMLRQMLGVCLTHREGVNVTSSLFLQSVCRTAAGAGRKVARSGLVAPAFRLGGAGRGVAPAALSGS